MNRKIWPALFVATLAAIFLQGCSVGEMRVGPPHWGRDTCEHCRMAITERRFAAQWVGPGAQIHFFDDLGCALAKKQAAPALKNAVLYVLSPQDGKTWLKAEQARYTDGLKTPMDYGIGPDRNGKLTFAQAQKILLKRVGSKGAQRHDHLYPVEGGTEAGGDN